MPRLLGALLCLLPLLVRADTLPVGTTTLNISSASDAMSYVGNWRSDTYLNVYEAYSNDSEASCTLSFKGVRVSYIAYKKYDRGLCGLRLDGVTTYTLDLYDNSGYAQGQEVIWQSPILPYGNHTIELYQLGTDPRFGVFPYLVSETWVEVYPTNIPSYTATMVQTTDTAVSTSKLATTSTHLSSPNLAPIIGGVVGGVLAVGLAILLFVLWRRDQRQNRRNEIGAAEAVKAKASKEKMSIDDDGSDSRSSAGDGTFGRGGDKSAYGSQYTEERSRNYVPTGGREMYERERRYNDGPASSTAYQRSSADASVYYDHRQYAYPSQPPQPFRQPSYEALSLTGRPSTPLSGNGSRGGRDEQSQRPSAQSYPYHEQAGLSYPVPEV